MLGNTVIVDNDITITSDDVNAANTLGTREGDLVIPLPTMDLNGAVGVDGALTINQTATTGVGMTEHARYRQRREHHLRDQCGLGALLLSMRVA